MTTDLLILTALVLGNGVFSGAEIAVLSIRKTRLRELLDAGNRSARAVHTLREHPERFLATVQIGITVLGATAGAFGGLTLARPLGSVFKRLGVSEPAAYDVALLIVVGGVSFASIVLGELIPKSLALRHAERYSLLVGRLFAVLSTLTRPLVWVLTASSNAVLRLFGDRTSFTEARLSPDELQQLVEDAAKGGSLDPGTGEIASRAFDFGALHVSAVMIPRARIVSVPRQASAEQMKRLILETGRSRMPVYDASPENIVGYVVAKDVLNLVWDQALIILDDILRPAYFVPETMRAPDLLKELQRRRMQMAIVVDEQGALAGLITTEDLVEELVGEIFSESEAPVQLVRAEPDGSALVQAAAPVHEVNRVLGINLPEGDQYSTINGLCAALAGAIPMTGARLITADGTAIEIVDATARRVRTVRIRPPGRREST